MNFLNSMFRLGVYEIDSKNHISYSSLAEIAQLGERQTEDLKVPGSILNTERNGALNNPGSRHFLFLNDFFCAFVLFSS